MEREASGDHRGGSACTAGQVTESSPALTESCVTGIQSSRRATLKWAGEQVALWRIPPPDFTERDCGYRQTGASRSSDRRVFLRLAPLHPLNKSRVGAVRRRSGLQSALPAQEHCLRGCRQGMELRDPVLRGALTEGHEGPQTPRHDRAPRPHPRGKMGQGLGVSNRDLFFLGNGTN